MFERDSWLEVYKTLKSNKLRTLLTGFGVFWGIFMLSVMLGAGSGLKNAVTSGFESIRVNTVVVFNGRTSKPYKGFQQGRWVDFNNNDVKALRDIPEIEYLSPAIQVETWRNIPGQSNVTHLLKKGSYDIQGNYPEAFKIEPVNMKEGRILNYLDLINKRKVVVLGKAVKDDLFPNGEDPIGKYVQIMGAYFQVIGSFSSKQSGGQGQEQNKRVMMPFTTMQNVYNYGDKVHYFLISAHENVSAEFVENKVKKILKEHHSVAPDDDQGVQSFNIEKIFKMVSGLFIGINVLIWIVGTGTLMAGIVGVSNIMIVILKERTREIGIQRAIGAHPWIIIRQIMMESLALTFIAGYIGLIIGVAIIEGVALLLEKTGAASDGLKNPEVNFSVAVTAVILLILSGLLAGFFPARRALKVKPIDAIRSE